MYIYMSNHKIFCLLKHLQNNINPVVTPKTSIPYVTEHKIILLPLT